MTFWYRIKKLRNHLHMYRRIAICATMLLTSALLLFLVASDRIIPWSTSEERSGTFLVTVDYFLDVARAEAQGTRTQTREFGYDSLDLDELTLQGRIVKVILGLAGGFQIINVVCLFHDRPSWEYASTALFVIGTMAPVASLAWWLLLWHDRVTSTYATIVIRLNLLASATFERSIGPYVTECFLSLCSVVPVLLTSTLLTLVTVFLHKNCPCKPRIRNEATEGYHV